MFAFVDETGNTGANLLDEAQPDFFTAALITKSNFDLVYDGPVSKLAKKFGDGALHGKDLGLVGAKKLPPIFTRYLRRLTLGFLYQR